MTTRRKNDDPNGHSRFRTERVLEDGGSWYFLTREGTVAGPFECKADAVERLEVYIRLAVNDLLLEKSELSLEN